MNHSRAILRLRPPPILQCRRYGATLQYARVIARCSSTAKDCTNVPTAEPGSDLVEAVVVGGGPAGIAVVGNLLETLPGRRQLWVDSSFQSGRVGARYREVPSNTKVDLFLQFATCLAPFKHILDSAPGPNAATKLQELPQDQGCTLGYAADLCRMLTDGIARQYPDRVQQHHGRVTAAALNKQTNLWTVALDSGKTVNAARVVLCTGSRPISAPLAVPSALKPGLTPMDLDVALKPSLLAKTLSPSAPATVAVIGASHSAILVLMNLYNLASATHPHLRVKWFTRHQGLRYAQYMDGWILYDNTGLKGQAAQWARENLEDTSASPVSNIITKLWTPPEDGKDDKIYHAELPGCSHIVQAIGYQRDPLPELYAVERPGATPDALAVEHDSLTGRFFNTSHSSAGQNQHVPGLFGAGIAFPERVTDPAGNVEYSVGLWKFMKFCRRVIPQWVAKP